MRSIDVDEDGKHGAIECVVPDREELPKGRVDVAEAAVRVRLAHVLGVDTTCVRADVALDEAREMMLAEHIRALPVVDERRRLVGMLSKSDLLRSGEVRKRRKKTVADVMTPLAHGLPEDAPVAYAISLMAFEGMHEVPVIDPEGHVIGMVTANDTLRWIAGALGYVAPSKDGDGEAKAGKSA